MEPSNGPDPELWLLRFYAQVATSLIIVEGCEGINCQPRDDEEAERACYYGHIRVTTLKEDRQAYGMRWFTPVFASIKLTRLRMAAERRCIHGINDMKSLLRRH